MTKKEKGLEFFLEKLEASADRILATQGYNKDASRLKTLEEIIKEQVAHANTRPPTRQIR